MSTGLRFVYFHGFASGPGSRKGRAVAERLAARGVHVDLVDLRAPSLERLSLAAMLERARASIGGGRDRAVAIGSSLGGLTAARLAAEDARVCMLALLAPAFGFAARWRQRLGEDGWARWMDSGWLEVHDHTTGRPARVHADFGREIERLTADPPDVRVPALIVHGVRDDVVPVTGSRAFAAGRRHVQLVEVDDGHELLGALPVVLEAIERFLAPALGCGYPMPP